MESPMKQIDMKASSEQIDMEFSSEKIYMEFLLEEEVSSKESSSEQIITEFSPDQIFRLIIIPNRLEELIACLDRWKNPHAPTSPTFEALQIIHTFRAVSQKWRDTVDLGVEYHALRLAEADAAKNQVPGWALYEDLVVSGFVRNAEFMQRERMGFNCSPRGLHRETLYFNSFTIAGLRIYRDTMQYVNSTNRC